MMKTSYILSGLCDPSTVIELAGSVFFNNNIHNKSFLIGEAKIEDGRLCLYYLTDDSLPQHLRKPACHYIKLNPSHGVVNLAIKEFEHNPYGKSHVIFYMVESMYTPARGDYFRYRKYEADLDHPFSSNITCNVSSEGLVKYGFVCTEEQDDDGGCDIVVYRRKE